MKAAQSFLLICWLAAAAAIPVVAQTPNRTQAPSVILRNGDILRMVEDGIDPGIIVTKILTSDCNFDIFPPVLHELKMRGVPVPVLLAMKMAPNGPPAASTVGLSAALPETAPVQIPAGTLVEVETAFPISSGDVKKGSPITFLVSRRVFVNNVLVIGRGAVARARVIRSKRAGAWGRAGTFVWAMEYVVAVDGTRVPLHFSDHSKGGNRVGAIAAGAAATTALAFPYTSPAALIWALKKGEEAVLPGSKRFTAVIRSDIKVTGLQSDENRVVYHYADRLKAVSTSSAAPLQTDSGGFKPTGSFRSRILARP